MPPAPVSEDKRSVISVVVVLVILAFALLVYFFYLKPTSVVETPPEAAPEESLGGGLYEKSQNPIGDKLPEQGSVVANPINDAYKNPFE